MTDHLAAPAAMSIDVEDWFHAENLKAALLRHPKRELESRIERNADRLLEILDRYGVRATFFFLGTVAEGVPQLVARAARAGHEIASHGYGHDLVYEIGPDAFRSDVDRARKLLEDLSGRPVRGYRAPNFSITDWAIDLLRETGHEYDSSAFPTFAHDRYGRLTGADGGRPVVELRSDFAEVCISCLKLGGLRLPWGGGGYFRLFPYRLFRRGIQRILNSNPPYVFYMHPWEIDPDQPRLKGLKATHRFRHYVNLDKSETRLGELLSDFRWTTIGAVLEWWRQREAKYSSP
jgi:polysaccharide deacetylase family protein (PEP-CTERM system associated)